MHEAMIAPRQNGAEPDGADPTQTESIPVAVSGKMGVNQRRQVHPLHLFEQQGMSSTRSVMMLGIAFIPRA